MTYISWLIVVAPAFASVTASVARSHEPSGSAVLSFDPAQAAVAQAAPPFADLDLVSANGCFRAEVRRAPGYEGRPPHLARWRVSVLGLDRAELWSAPFDYDGSARHWLVSEDGSMLVHVREHFQDFRPLLDVVHEGGAITGPSGSSFELDPRKLERTPAGKLWLADGGVPSGTTWLETALGPRLVLPLACRDGSERVVDLESGRVLHGEDFAALATATVAPALEARLASIVELSFVGRFAAPARARAGHALSIDVFADHPTPGWKFEGFVLVQSGDFGRDLSLSPYSRKPVGDAAQVLVPFQARAELTGLAPGGYRVRVVGRTSPEPSWQELEIVPADHLCSFRRSGGIAGLSESCEVLGRGEVRFHSEREGARTRCLPPTAIARIGALLERLPDDARRAKSPGADLFQYRIVHWREGLPIELDVDDGTADTAMRELMGLLDALR